MNYTPNLFQRINKSIAYSKPGSWIFSRLLHHIDNLVLRLTKGKRSAAAILANVPIVSLTAIGAKSGQPRTVPLLGVPDGESFVLIASNWGQKHYPAWYYNAIANPKVQLTIDGVTREYVAVEIEDEAEQARVWQNAVEIYAGYDQYRQRASHRRIPILRLMPTVQTAG